MIKPLPIQHINVIVIVFSAASPFHGGGRHHIGTSPLICGANQWTCFYMITASIMKGLKAPSQMLFFCYSFNPPLLHVNVH